MKLGDLMMGGLEFPLTVIVTIVANWVLLNAKVKSLEKSLRGAFAEIRGLKDDFKSVEKALGRARERLVRLESALFTPPAGYRLGGGRNDDDSGES